MKTRHLAVTGLVAALAYVAPALGHVVPLTAQELVWDSHDVVVATVLDKTAVRVGASGAIVTRYRLAVEENLRGETPREITVEVFGGTLDGETQETCMTVTLAVGSRYVLFVNDPGNPGFSTFTGAQQGVLKDPGSTAGAPGLVTSISGPMAVIAGDKPVTFAAFVERLRAFVAKSEAEPAPPARAAVVHDPPLPAKRLEVPGDPPFDPTPEVPCDAAQSVGPPAPARPEVVNLDASYVTEVPRAPEPDVSYSYSRAPGRYIVWNELHPVFAPWAGRDQAMMVRWNTYGDIFRVSGAPLPSWQWANNVFDIAGFVADPTMYFVFGRVWGASELAICFSRWTSGPIIESDIVVNPAFPWTLDNEVGTRHDSPQWGFDQTILHELGHSWGLAHPFEVQDVWWDSVMNYSPKEYRFPEIHADDAAAIRSAYPGIALHDGLISFYRTQDQAGNTNATYVNVDPITYSVQQMGSFQIWDAFKVENVGTDTIVNPRVDVYLTHSRMSWSAYEYVQTLSYSATMLPSTTLNLSSGNITVPFNMPPGEYSILLWLYDALDSQPYNNEAWSTAEYNHMTVLSYPWTISPQASWQFQQVRTGPYGSYDFYFPGVADTRVDISTCPADGGFADYDTILDLSDPVTGLVATSDDACGVQSRISFRLQANGQHHIALRGFTYEYGTARMQYRLRNWPGSNLHLSASRHSGTGTVGLSWVGDVGPYDVQRSTTPTFTSPVLIGNGQEGTTLEDPVLASGAAYFYRVR